MSEVGNRKRSGRNYVEVPKCGVCKRVRVLDPCRDCATPERQKRLGYPPGPFGNYRYTP